MPGPPGIYQNALDRARQDFEALTLEAEELRTSLRQTQERQRAVQNAIDYLILLIEALEKLV